MELVHGDTDEIDNSLTPVQQAVAPEKRKLWFTWFEALKQVWPIYAAIHLTFLALTYLAILFDIGNFSPKTLPGSTLLHSWYRWDSGQFVGIVTFGYNQLYRTAFFPLFPLLEKGLGFLIPNFFVAGLIIANIADLAMLVVLYQLVREDFDQERAYRTVLYLSLFPTAFFFVAAYNESLFLCFILLSFYQMRHGRWWLAGLFGLLASLTRSAGVLLFLPFCYEYLRQRQFNPRAIRFDVLAGLGIAAGLGIFMLYCAYNLHDPLAFSQAQQFWHRHLALPWQGFSDAVYEINIHRVLSFDSIHNVIDLTAGLFMLVLVVLCFVGPWKFPAHLRAYSLYGALLLLFLLSFPATGTSPLQSLSRLVLEIFPAFIVLAATGKNRQWHLYYLSLSVMTLAFMLLQFLTGRWIV